MLLFGTSGIRRIVDYDFIQLSLKVGLALGSLYPRIVIGCDTRTSSDAVKYAFLAGLLTSGAEGFDAGVIPTPTLGLAAKGFDTGAMITASHNPPEYNGIKLWNPDGSAFSKNQQDEIEKLVTNDSTAAPWQKIKKASIFSDAVKMHMEVILKKLPDKMKTRVVLDCGCGAASVITPYVLSELGCEVIAINSYPSGFFPRNPEPSEENLKDLIKVVKELKANVGIAHDGDADRMMAVDDKGHFISGDKLLAIFARDTGAKEVITTIDATMAVEEMGFKVRRTPVGDPYVSIELKKGGDFGGEPSGSWIFPEISFCPDGIYAAARIAGIAGEHRLSSMVGKIPSYPMLRRSVSSDGISRSKLEQKLMEMEPLSINKTDGFKLVFNDGWVLVRPSGTEPKIRITAEAKSEARLHELYDKCFEIVSSARRG